MMLRISFLLPLFFLLFFISCKKALEKNSPKEADFFVIKKTYQHEESENNLVLIEKDYFNKNNQLIQSSSFHKAFQFDISGKNKYYYNSQLQLIKFEAYSRFVSGGLTKVYDTTYTYENSLVKTKIKHDALDKVENIVEYFYTGDTLIKEYIKFPLYTPYQYWYEYEYDSLGRLSVKKMYNDVGLQRTYKFSYSGNKLVSEAIEYNNSKDIFEYIYNGSLLAIIEKFEQVGTAQPTLFAKDMFFYDQNGRLKKKVSSNGRVSFDPPVFTYVYIYEY